MQNYKCKNIIEDRDQLLDELSSKINKQKHQFDDNVTLLKR